MNEHEFRQALHATMTVAAPPEPMSEAPVLDRAKRDRRRRQATWAGAGSAAAVVAVVAGAMVLAPTADDGAPGLSVGEAAQDTTEETKPEWPDGQTDATASSGPRYDQGVTLFNELIGAVPDGYEAPDGLVYADPDYPGGGALRYHQATISFGDSWEYYGIVPVSAGEGLGKIFVQVNTVGNGVTGEGCELSRTLWDQTGGTCEEITVAGTTLGVVTDTGPESNFDQWVGFRHPDGTVVYAAQDNEFEGAGKPPLTSAPFTAQQLAELATDARFHLD